MIIDTPALDVFEHMAVDEIMCQDLPDPFILRFFKWADPPSAFGEGRSFAPATFGYSQRYLEVVSAAGGDGQLVRRPTGGGLVHHDCDITFSCIFEMPGVLSPNEIYARIHGAVHSGLKNRGIHSALMSSAPQEETGPGMKCFVRPVPMDIVISEPKRGQGPGRKILGGALRRFGDHVLYQGSLQINGTRNGETEFHSAISRALALEWSVKWNRRELDDGVISRIRALAGTKYRSEEWNKRI